MGVDIYVVGMASVYAGAKDLRAFWETVLTRRSGFREFPRQRLPLDEYVSANRNDRDKTYAARAALIDGFEFDWKAHRVPRATFEATDPVHWLALTAAIGAIEDAGVGLDAVGRDRVGVILGNSLTGEVSRANLLRLRWPYVRRAVADGAARAGLPGSELAALLGEIERSFKESFPAPNEDTLAGALSNVIAGRICNVLDLKGGGYVVDGACASSLLAAAAACEALAAGRLDMAVVGGVDISLDPLEMVGFARTGALAEGPMRVYDQEAAGFLPGEGCGMLVLMRGREVERHGLRPWARIAGWGISSDGSGGITAPKASGQALAMRRCYARSGFGADTLDFIEGHGTGTPVGDRQELLGFLEVTGGGDRPFGSPQGGSELRRTGLTSIKTLLGHTKAAAGAAGLIKAVLAVNQRVLPPLAGLRTPAEAFGTPGAHLYPLSRGSCLPPETGLRAGVSGAGFGGINCHIALTGEGIQKRRIETREASRLLASAQNAELFVASADDVQGLLARVEELSRLSRGMAEGELVDLAAACALGDRAGPLRAAVVAETVDELRARLAALSRALEAAGGELPPAPPGTLLGRANPKLRIGYLIPGQGSQFVGMGRILAERSDWAAARRARWDAQFAALGPAGLSGFIDRPTERADTPEVAARWETALRDTRIAQPAIVMTSLQWLQWLHRIGITPSAVVGHSLGEIAALVAAGLLSEAEAADIVRVRAEACAAEDVSPGGMLALKCGAAAAQEMVRTVAGYAVVANDNAPDQVVVAGDPETLAAIAGLARGSGIEAVTLNVSRAFHSSRMAAAAEALAHIADGASGERDARVPFFSVVLGGLAPGRLDPFAYLAAQVMAPVRFREAVRAIAAFCDILVEVGPGSVLTGLARRTLGKALPVCALEPGPGDTDTRFCAAMGRIFVAGAPLDWKAYYADRYWRPFVPAGDRKFIDNPCAREGGLAPTLAEEAGLAPGSGSAPANADPPGEGGIEDLIRELVARETGYDLEMISPEMRLAEDLNLDSIKVAEVRAELRARDIDLPEDLALGATPIRGIARVAVRKPRHAGDERTAGAPAAAMPGNLPVLGYCRTWRDAEIVPVRSPIGLALILSEPERAGEAGRLAERLAAAGVRVRIDDGTRPVIRSPGDPPARLIALPGTRASADRVVGFFARLGAWVGAGAEAVVLVSRAGLAPVFGFAQSLSLDLPGLPVLAVEAGEPVDLAGFALGHIEPGVRLLRAEAGHACRRPALDLWVPPPATAIPLQAGEVVVISGGAKGITAECALALLRATRARALLLGTSPEEAPGAEAEGTLRRMAAAGLEAVYLSCDVTDEASVRAALRRGAERMGTRDIAGLVHGAGVNLPAPATRLDPVALRREYAVKVEGLRNLLAGIGAERLKLCVALGSVIGAVGMYGNGGYALANETLAGMLEDLRRAHPGMQIACPAYGVWSEVGMGAKLDVLSSLAARQIAAIPPGEGARWFLECCRRPDVPLPLVVAAPMQGLPTWRQARGTGMPAGLPFTGDRVVHESGVVLVSRPSLNPEREAWLADHAFRGALLFPTVQALTAMGNGARLLAGAGVITRFMDLRIARPIVAAPHGNTPIELDVRRAGMPAPSGVEGRAPGGIEAEEWIGRVGAPGAAWMDPAFDARCRLGIPEREDSVMGEPDSAAFHPGYRPVPPEAGTRLYDSILFQGTVFQRIEALLELDLSDGVRRRGRFRLRRERSEPGAPVPDAFFLDALLQCVQVLVPKDLCLPVGIAEIVFYAAAWEAGATLVEAEITERIPTGYLTRVRAWNAAGGAPVARYEGYRVSIVETRAARPDAEALFDPAAADRAALAEWLAGYPDAAGLTVALGAADDGEGQRVPAWNAGGTPVPPDRPGPGVSIAHDAGRLLTVSGTGVVGCGLHRVDRGSRSRSEWLPALRHRLRQGLTEAMNDRGRAVAVVRAIQEALAGVGAAEAGVAFIGMEDGSPRFHLAGGGLIVAGVLELAIAGPVAVALVQRAGGAESGRVTHYTRDIEMTFKDALPPLKSPTAPIFFTWMGALREEAMSGLRSALAHAFGEGGKGMVTNGTRLRILRPLRFATPLRAWVWLDRVLAGRPSTFELGFQWAETGPEGAPRRIVAQGVQRLTWVDVGPEGRVTVAPFPAFFARFIAERLPPPGTGPFTPPLGQLPEPRGGEAVLWRRGPDSGHEHGTARLWLETDETHSNFVGNIYFSHAAVLAERACRKALRGLGAGPGGFFATALRLDHLGEAMPGDTLEAEVRLAEVGATYCTFDLALMNRSRGEAKIATGSACYRLFTLAPSAIEGEDFEPQPMPRWLIPAPAEETP